MLETSFLDDRPLVPPGLWQECAFPASTALDRFDSGADGGGNPAQTRCPGPPG